MITVFLPGNFLNLYTTPHAQHTEPYFTMYTALRKLHTSNFTTHTTHFTLHRAHFYCTLTNHPLYCTLHTPHCQTAQCTQQTAHYTLMCSVLHQFKSCQNRAAVQEQEEMNPKKRNVIKFSNPCAKLHHPSLTKNSKSFVVHLLISVQLQMPQNTIIVHVETIKD